MLTLEQGMILSAIADKLDLEIDIKGAESSIEQVGADLMTQLMSRAHRAKDEIYLFVADVKGCTAEEAKRVSLVQFIKEVASDKEIVDFFKAAAK